MKLPLSRLKREARAISRAEKIPLHAALDRLAARQGFKSWSLLAAKASHASPAAGLWADLQPGDTILLAARPRQGKTLMSIALAIEAMKAGRQCFFFSLEYSEHEVADRFRMLGGEPAPHLLKADCSDAICADYIIAALATAAPGSLVVVDYLQLLDQRRSNADLASQVAALKSFAVERGLVFAFISQVDRSFETSGRPMPGLVDIRLPNPVELALFNKRCFLNGGRMRIEAA